MSAATTGAGRDRAGGRTPSRRAQGDEWQEAQHGQFFHGGTGPGLGPGAGGAEAEAVVGEDRTVSDEVVGGVGMGSDGDLVLRAQRALQRQRADVVAAAAVPAAQALELAVQLRAHGSLGAAALARELGQGAADQEMAGDGLAFLQRQLGEGAVEIPKQSLGQGIGGIWEAVERDHGGGFLLMVDTSTLHADGVAADLLARHPQQPDRQQRGFLSQLRLLRQHQEHRLGSIICAVRAQLPATGAMHQRRMAADQLGECLGSASAPLLQQLAIERGVIGDGHGHHHHHVRGLGTVAWIVEIPARDWERREKAKSAASAIIRVDPDAPWPRDPPQASATARPRYQMLALRWL